VNSALLHRLEASAAETKAYTRSLLGSCDSAASPARAVKEFGSARLNQNLWGISIAEWHSWAQVAVIAFTRGHNSKQGRVYGGLDRSVGNRMPKPTLVAIVEDDRFFRDSMRRLMRSWGYSVEVFPSAADFLASPHLNETDCLIADVHMPAMNGLELYRHLIASGFQIPTILVTGYADDQTRVRALKDGVACYLRKPVDEEHLLACLHGALQSREPTNDD
jgi:CheY-like chemotaxis protein